MKERPIIFNTEMVMAILDGRKTMTRRVIKDSLSFGNNYNDVFPYTDRRALYKSIEHYKEVQTARCPYGQPGDRLWVRETWAYFGTHYHYRTDGLLKDGVWKPSIHMPRKASRILLEVDEVRVERLQDINEEDAREEGFERTGSCFGCGACMGTDCYVYPDENFEKTWNSIYKKQGLGFDANPWVWVIKFHRLEAKE